LTGKSKKASSSPIYAKPMSSGKLSESACHNLPARFQPPPLWLEERIREALVERAEAGDSGAI